MIRGWECPALQVGTRDVERKLLAITVALMGVGILASWLPQREVRRLDPMRPAAFVPQSVPVPPGHRGIVRGPDGTPAANVDVFLTESFGWQRIYGAVRTNAEGHFPLLVPPGNYRVQGLFIDHEIFIPEDRDHPDIEVPIVPRPLLRFLANVPLDGVKTAASDEAAPPSPVDRSVRSTATR